MLFLVLAVSLHVGAPLVEPVAPPTQTAIERAALYEFLAGAAAAAVTVPLTVALGTWLGTLSNHLVLAALPSLLLVLAVPPLVVTGVAHWAGNASAPGAARFSPAVWAALGVQVVTLVAVIAIGASSRDVGAVAALTAAEMVLLPGAVAGVMHATRPKEAPASFQAPLFGWSF